ncbi:CaiB/BaiF CoA transferase family protein [Verticiella sediminum]|nr:CoA transferase [Verticiella sediminum]
MAPLSGIRVVDLTRFISGPYLTMFLGDLGADVIKIEHPLDGDATRRWGSGPFPSDNPYYLSVNRNKRSIGLDLKHADGMQTLEALIAKSDVLVINAIAGALEQLGLSETRLRAINPQCVICEITGYGDRGPDRRRGAFDFTIQAESGMMALNGDPDGSPMKVGAPIMDVLTGLTACIAVQSALYERQSTGRAPKVSTSMMETALACMPNIVSDYLVAGIFPHRYGNAHPNLVPYEVYETSDRWLALGLGNEPQWKRLCTLIERPDLRDDERFSINTARIAHREALNQQLKPVFAAQPLAWWLQSLARNAIPCAAVNTVADALDSEQIRAMGMVQDVEHPLYRSIKMVRSPISIDGNPLPIRRPPPCLGQHTDDILSGVLGLAPERIAALRASGAVSGTAPSAV